MPYSAFNSCLIINNMKRLLLVLLILEASAFAPPPVDHEAVARCNGTGGVVNISYYDPDDSNKLPGRDMAPMTIFNCECPASTEWEPQAGCAPTTTTIEPVDMPEVSKGFIEIILDYIRGLLWFLL